MCLATAIHNFKWPKITHICLVWAQIFANLDVGKHMSFPITVNILTTTIRPLRYERVYLPLLPLCKVAETLFHIKGDEFSRIRVTRSQTLLCHHIWVFFVVVLTVKYADSVDAGWVEQPGHGVHSLYSTVSVYWPRLGRVVFIVDYIHV